MTAWIVATAILLAGVVDDLRSRKIHNALVLVLAAIALVTHLILSGTDAFVPMLFSFAIALAMTVPLVLVGVLGGGDMKLLAAFALLVNWSSVVWVLLYSFVWGALLGLVRSGLQGQLVPLLKSTLAVAARQKTASEALHRMPFSVAMLLGWLTESVIMRLGVWS